MRKVLLILVCIFSLIACQEKEYSLDDLEEKNGISHIKGSDHPYTGETIERLKEQITAINIFEKGVHIKGTTFYPNGNKEYEIEFKNGKENGYWRQYFYNGHLNYETYKIDGIRNGKTKSYYENGQLEFEREYDDDNLIGESKSYYENGKTRSEYDSLGTEFYYYKDGKILMKKEKGKEELFYNKEGKQISPDEAVKELENQ